MQLTIKNGKGQLTVTKPELRRLENAMEVIEAMIQCGEEEAEDAREALVKIIRQAKYPPGASDSA